MAVLTSTLPPSDPLAINEKIADQLEEVFHQNLVPKVSEKNDDLLIVSPYVEEAHLLDLKTVDTANQLLAKGLVELKCLREDYATAPYVDIFNVSKYPPN